VPAILERTNPFGNLVATVDDDGRCVYLYVHHAQYRGWGFRPLWLANRPSAGAGAGANAQGQAPRLDADRTDHPEGHPGFAPDDLEIVWTPSGDGVFLLHRGELLAHLPGVDDTLGSPGFSRLAVAKDRYAWAMKFAPDGLAREASKARAFWDEVRAPAAWEAARDRMLAAGAAAYGAHEVYWAIDETKWPPLGVARYAHAGHHVFTTVGMSLPRMPAPTDAGLDRMEIAFAARGQGLGADGGWCVQTAGWLGRYPWSWYTPLEDGALVMAPTAHATWFAPDRSAVLLVEDLAAWLPGPFVAPAPPPGVRLSWAIFLTADEVKTVELRGPDAFRERFRAGGRTLVFEP
jgi:hypothetical protein